MIIIPDIPNIVIEDVSVANEITLTVRTTSPTACCSSCGATSERVQSRYMRTLHDLPASGRPVTLLVQVRRFFCPQRSCPRKIFAEPLPELCRPHAQRTLRLQKALSQLGLTVGGQAGAEVGSKQGLSGSRDTILRLVRTTEPPVTVSPKKVGVDDWAWKRGHRYGTLLCDLERALVIDLLPDRSEETVADWFAAHPSIELISRDGSAGYAVAALKGAPQAIQVSDKWHLVKNLAKALQVLLTSHLTVHRKKKTQEVGQQKEFASLPNPERKLSLQQAHLQSVHREERLARYEQVIALAKQGMSQELIGRLTGVGHSTVSRWLRAGTFPERKPREQASQLDPYRSYVRKRQSQGYGNLLGIYRELQSLGYQGSYANVCAQFANSSPKKVRRKQAASSPLPPPFPSAREATWLFLRRQEELTTQEKEMVERLRQLHESIDLAYLLVQQFLQMVRTRTGERLDAWLEAVASSSLADLQSFANGVLADKEAVFAGLTREESNGPTEGHITRLKLIKRSMYGRAHFDLLRLRVLSPSKKRKTIRATQAGADHKPRKGCGKSLLPAETGLQSQLTTSLISEVA
jgi:transposase